MINITQLRELIIKPALLDLIYFSEDAMELLVFTCAVESEGGTYLKQIKGPALGIYQMQPDTYNNLWDNHIKKEPSLLMRLFSNFQVNRVPEEERLIYDLRFASCMTRIFYSLISEPIPSLNNTESIWNYYKKYYNTNSGKAEKNESIRKYMRLINS